ncbi:helix-turn-helix domain-containing protein [Salmonella enterica subsp. enterica serovar Enteritidis]|nr:helix-turn-helix domain-containing protein [Salmonella enterica subsp. enterica serovar Enteritidis]
MQANRPYLYINQRIKPMMKLHRLVAWIEKNLHLPLSISLIAQKAGCSPRYLSSIFKNTYDISIASYIQKRRLTLASALLRTTSRSITEIALMYQFTHVASFSRAFKNQFGLSPVNFRLADCWDMKLFLPSAAIYDFTCHTAVVSIPENIFITPLKNKKKGIHLGVDFILTTENGKVISDQKLNQSIIDIIFHKDTIFPAMVLGTVNPGKESDTDVEIIIGTLTTENSIKYKINILSGHYACFSYKGTPSQIMRFNAWARGHGMHRCHLIMKKGPTFSVFYETTTEGIFKTELYIPCMA